MPTYQRRDVVCSAVRALADVHYAGNFELIVVVDGSTDGTAAALREVSLPFAFTVLEQLNGGAAAARNRGASVAQNDILLFLDDDMMAEPNLLEEHGRLHRDGADAAIGDTPVHPGSPDGFLPVSVGRWTTSRHVQSPLSPFDIFSGQLSVRRALFEELSGFDTALTSNGAFGNEDADFGVRLLSGHDVRHNPDAVSRQVYVVTPRQYMDRAGRAVAADIRFMRKHPELARELLERKGYSRPLTRFVYRPLARIPALARVISRVAVGVADTALKTPFRSSRTVARLFSGARSIAYWSALHKSGWHPISDRPLVLCYHAIEDQSADPVLATYGVAPGLFKTQLESLASRGFSFISPDQLAAYLNGTAALPRRAVLLTFDDGYAGLVDVARTILRPRGIEGLVFAVTGVESGTNEWDQPYGAKAQRLLTPAERVELQALGIEIGSHSRSHREMPKLDPSELAREAAGSRDDLLAGGLQPRFFAYPYGARDEAAKRAVKAAGFTAAFGTRHRRIERSDDRFDLPRVMIVSSDRGWRFWVKTSAPRLWAGVERVRGKFAAVLKRVRP